MHQRKRPEDRIGHRSAARDARDLARYGYAQGGPVSHGRSRRAELPAIPQASEKWLPQSRSWFNSLKLSGQSAFYEASDWATAVAAAQCYDIFLRTRNASTLAHFVRLSERLGATVVDRKRMHIELDEPEPRDSDEEAADDAVTGWHQKLRHLRPVD
jgi:hypothetical protein